MIIQLFPGLTGSWTKVKTLTSGRAQIAIIYNDEPPEYSEYDAIIVDRNDTATIRIMTGSHTRRPELLPLLEQIASTFEFTD